MGSLPFREGTGLREPVPGTGSGNRFRELVGFRTRGIAKVPGLEGFVPEVSQVSVFAGPG